MQKGGKIVRKVTVKKGRGYKSVTKYRKGKKVYSVKKPIHRDQLFMIKMGKFIPGLFSDCKYCKTKKRRGKNRRGGSNDYDLESGPEINIAPMKSIPPDPERFEKYNEEFIKSSLMRSSTPSETENVFANPNPNEREMIERTQMIDEDPLYKDPFEVEDLEIFKKNGGMRYRRK